MPQPPVYKLLHTVSGRRLTYAHLIDVMTAVHSLRATLAADRTGNSLRMNSRLMAQVGSSRLAGRDSRPDQCVSACSGSWARGLCWV